MPRKTRETTARLTARAVEQRLRHRCRSRLKRSKVETSTRQTSSFLGSVALTTALVFASMNAGAAEPRADDTERAEAKAIEAKAFFQGGLYPQAANSYMQGFAISHNPATLYNAARAYEEGNLYAEAIALFEQYLKQPGIPPDGLRDAKNRIVTDRKQLRSVEKAAGKKPVIAAPDKAVTPTVAHDGMTERCGKVAQVAVHADARPSFFNFGQRFPKQTFAAVFSAAVRDSLVKEHGDLRKAYEGKAVCVKGKLEAADGKERVIVAGVGGVWLQGAPAK